MMIEVEEFASSLDALLDWLEQDGEILITRQGTVVARLVPTKPSGMEASTEHPRASGDAVSRRTKYHWDYGPKHCGDSSYDVP